MKVEFIEHEGCFEIYLEAETKEDVVKLARFGIGKTKEIRNIAAFFQSTGTASASVVVGKKKTGATTL